MAASRNGTPCNSLSHIVDSLAHRYPQLTFDLFADTFACPSCSGYCNCSICAPKRGEKYVPERDGGWRSWIVQQGGGSYLATVPAPPRAFATKMKSSKTKTPVKATSAPAPAKKRVPKTTITPTTPIANMPVFDSSWSATPVFTVSGEPLGNAFLHGNTAHVVPLVLPLPPTPPPATNSSTPETAQTQKRRYVFIGKPRKAWGRLVSLPDPEPNQFEQKVKGKGIARRGRRSNKRTLFFVGSLEPLLLARRQRRRRRRSAWLDTKVDKHPGEDGEEYEDADAD